MERAVRRLASKIAASMGFDAEREAVIAYGLIALVQILITFALVIVFGLLVGAVVETLIVCLSVSFLRKYSGGAHADDADFCTVLTVIICTLAALAARALLSLYQPWAMAGMIVLAYVAAYWIANRYVPVDSPNKPIKTEQKIKRMRRGSFSILSVYALASVLFFLLGFQFHLFQSYGIALLLGVCWQVFTLTPIGAILLHKLNVLPKCLGKEVSK